MTRTSYKNQHIKEHYDRINFVIPKGEKDRIKKICSEIGASVNEYLYMLVCNDLADGTSRMAEKRQGFCKICFATSTLEQGINMLFDVVYLEYSFVKIPIRYHRR